MEEMLGLLRIHIIRGLNLAIRDANSSDPYIVVKMGSQKLKTKVMYKNVNPEWKEDLTLSISDPKIPIKLKVYDKDVFTIDDKMGDAVLDIGPLIEAVKKTSKQTVPNGTVLTKVIPNKKNNLAEESKVIWENGKVSQNMLLNLCNVECGLVELTLKWIDVPGARSL